MYSAIWLFIGVPKWYFGTIFAPFSAGVFTLVPAIGVVALAIGALWGAMRRRFGLAVFLALPAASQMLVVVAGFMRGRVGHNELHYIFFGLSGFILLQLVAACYLVFRLTAARLPALALAIFSLTYALFASFVALMSFQDTWL